MNIENTPNKKEHLDRIPLKERMAFQVVLMKSIFGEKSSYDTEEKWNKVTIEWIDAYIEIINNIIDNIKNKEIRDLIMKKEYREASTIVAKILKEKKL